MNITEAMSHFRLGFKMFAIFTIDSFKLTGKP
jgi:hypothetical protein